MGNDMWKERVMGGFVTDEEQFEYITKWFECRYLTNCGACDVADVAGEGLVFSIRDVFEIEFGSYVCTNILNRAISHFELKSSACDLLRINKDCSRGYEKHLVKPISHFVDYNEFMNDVGSVLSLRVDGHTEVVVNNMLFVFMFSVYEGYLADSFFHCVVNDRSSLTLFLNDRGKSAGRDLQVSDVDFTHEREAEEIIRSRIVWHRAEKSFKMFKKYCNIDVVCDVVKMEEYVKVRHDIVHRAGKKLDDDEVQLTREKLREFMGFVDDIVRQIDKSLPCSLVRLEKIAG